MKRLFLILVFVMTAGLASELFAQSDSTFAVSSSPNPFEDQVTVQISHGGKSVGALKVLDAIGKEVYFIDLNAQSKSPFTSLVLDLGSLKPGLYFMNIYSERGVVLETRRIYRSNK